MYDVIVAGAGPAGTVGAKRCAEKGLKTLLIERRRLPRDKVCCGLIMGRLAKTMVEEGFAELPREIVLSTLPGLTLWVPGAGQRTIHSSMAITWRRDLDFWMTREALEKGVEVWDRTVVKGLTGDGKACSILVKKQGITQELRARFVIGAGRTPRSGHFFSPSSTPPTRWHTGNAMQAARIWNRKTPTSCFPQDRRRLHRPIPRIREAGFGHIHG